MFFLSVERTHIQPMTAPLHAPFWPTRWEALWKSLSAKGDPTAALILLLHAYAEPHRAYHTLVHLHACLMLLDEVRDLTEHPTAVEMALWAHDVVYDPRAHDNEARSAEWVTPLLRAAHVAPEVIAHITDLIFATQHTRPPNTPDAALIMDIDLAILGQPPEVFDAYEHAVRQEYAHVSEAAFRVGRRAVVQQFLERVPLYYTAFFQQRFEAAARANLRRSLERWR